GPDRSGPARPARDRERLDHRSGPLARPHRCGVLHPVRSAPARCGPSARLPRHRGPAGPSLCLAAASTVRDPWHHPSQLLRPHHPHRGRRPDRGRVPHRRALQDPVMTSPLASLYTELVMEHDKRPLHAGLREPFDTEVHHVNPTCGDEITLRLHLEGSGEQLRVTDLSYEAIGCAMSRASASIMSDLLIGRTITEILPVQQHFATANGCAMSRASASIMSDLLIGRTITEILPVQEHFEAAIGSRGRIPGDQELVGDGIALMGAAKFPARIKCVLMPWKAYQAALVEA